MRRAAVTAQARVETTLTLRRGESLLATLGIPVGVLVFFSTLDVIDTGLADDLDFLVPGVLALAVMATAMVSLGIATGFERRYGVLKRLGTTPLGRGGLVLAKTVSVLAVEAIQLAVIIAVAVALGWDATTRLAPAAGFLALGTVAFAGLGLLMAGALRAELTLALTNTLYVGFLLFGGVAVPLDRLPGPAEALARLTPGAQLVATVRGALTAGAGIPTWAWAGLLVWAVLAPIAAAALFRWEE